jgi:hypothetical protein
MKRFFGARRTRVLGSGAVFVALAATAMTLFVPSAGATNIVQLQSPGYLRARGAAAEVTVMVACRLRARTVGAFSTPARATLAVGLVERTGKRTAGGSAKLATRNHDFRCDGNSHLVTLLVPAKVGAHSFSKGGAFGQATLTVCSPTCRSVTDERTIRLR